MTGYGARDDSGTNKAPLFGCVVDVERAARVDDELVVALMVPVAKNNASVEGFCLFGNVNSCSAAAWSAPEKLPGTMLSA